MAVKTSSFIMCCLIIVFLTSACNNKVEESAPSADQLLDRTTPTITQTYVPVNTPTLEPISTALPSPTITLIPTQTPIPTITPTWTPEPTYIKNIIGVWEGSGSGSGPPGLGTFDTEIRVEVRSHCESNNPCIDIYRNGDELYSSVPYDYSFSSETEHCFYWFDQDSFGEYMICLSPQPDGTVEFSESEICCIANGVLYRKP